jgi:hypothetical protein
VWSEAADALQFCLDQGLDMLQVQVRKEFLSCWFYSSPLSFYSCTATLNRRKTFLANQIIEL